MLDVVDAEGRPQQLVRCGVCELVQVDQAPDPKELLRFYSKYCYDSEESWAFSPATQASIGRVAERMEPYRSSGRVLDVGSGAGAFLAGFVARGWNVEGTELSDVAAPRVGRHSMPALG